MKNKLLYGAVVLAAALSVFTGMSTTAHAQGNETTEDTSAVIAAEPTGEAVEGETTVKTFTPEGTGTVVDNATDEEGKEFFTITTSSENVFYLVIDRQRTGNNVYFLNAVTESDLMALAETGPEPEAAETEVTEPVTEPGPEPIIEAEPEPEKDSGSRPGRLLLIALVLLAGGGAAYYFKIYRPKQESADNDEDDYEDYDYGEDDPYGDLEEETETEDEE